MTKKVEIRLETRYGDFQTFWFTSRTNQACLAVYRKPWGEYPFVRVHSSCLFSESLGANDCDCAPQLNASLKRIGQEGGVVIYLFQEGRGIGLPGKIEAIYEQQQHGINTIEAYKRIGQESELRTYEIVKEVLNELGLQSVGIRLATNNPKKIEALEALGVLIKERVALEIDKSDKIQSYVAEKMNLFGHHGKT